MKQAFPFIADILGSQIEDLLIACTTRITLTLVQQMGLSESESEKVC